MPAVMRKYAGRRIISAAEGRVPQQFLATVAAVIASKQAGLCLGGRFSTIRALLFLLPYVDCAVKFRRMIDTFSKLATLLILVVGGCWLAWAALPRMIVWHQERLAQQLAERAMAASDAEAKVQIRQLGDLGTPAVHSLVAAVASPRAVIADTAREELDLLLANHQTRMAHQVTAANADALMALAEALAKHAPKMRSAGRRWAEAKILRLIDLSEQLPPLQATRILESSSRVLESLPAQGPRLQSVEVRSTAPAPSTDPELQLPPIDITRLAVPTERTLAKRSPTTDSNSSATTEVIREEIEADSTLQPDRSPQPDQQVNRIPRNSSGESSISVEVGPPVTPPTKPNWIRVPNPEEARRRVAQLRKKSTTDLLRELPSEDPILAAAIRDQLRQRGVSAAEANLAERITQADSSERLKFIDQIGQLPAISARRLLRQMLQDEDAEVRRRALAMLATTGDPQLAELAREVALGDGDPQVAELASELMRK